MYIYYQCGVFLAGYDCLIEQFNTLIRKLMYITFCLQTEPQDYVAAENQFRWMAFITNSCLSICFDPF